MKIISGFFILIVAFGCTKKHDVSKSTIARVNSQNLTVEVFSEQLLNRIKYFDTITLKQPEFIDHIKKNLINEFIIKVISETYAKNNNIFVKTKELDESIEKIRTSYPDDLTFRQSLAQEKVTFRDWKKKIRFKLLQKKIQIYLNGKIKKPSTIELKKYYNAHQEDFKVMEARKLQQIVAHTKVDAEIILKKLKKGRKMEDLSKYSITPEARNSGHLGWIEKGLSPTFDQVFKVRTGRLAPIIKSEYGYHIIKVLNKKSSRQLGFHQAKSKVVKILTNKREQALFSSWLDEEIRKSKIFKNEELINTIYPEIRG